MKVVIDESTVAIVKQGIVRINQQGEFDDKVSSVFLTKEEVLALAKKIQEEE